MDLNGLIFNLIHFCQYCTVAYFLAYFVDFCCRTDMSDIVLNFRPSLSIISQHRQEEDLDTSVDLLDFVPLAAQ